MSTTNRLWSFENNWDRLTFLLAEFKWPLIVLLAGVSVLLVFTVNQIPNPFPPWTFTFAFGWVVAALPLYVLFLVLFQSRETDDRETVGLADPGTKDIYDGFAVDPDLWDSKSVVGYPPYSPKEGYDYVVTKFTHYEEIGELEVRGVDPDMTPASSWNASEKVDDVHDHFHQVKRKYTNQIALVNDYATKIHDAAILGLLGEREDASLAPGVNPQGIIEEMEADVEDLPDAPEPDPAPQQARAQGVAGDVDVPEPERNESVRIEPPREDGGGER